MKLAEHHPHTKMARAEFVKAERKRKDKPERVGTLRLGGECLQRGGEDAAVS